MENVAIVWDSIWCTFFRLQNFSTIIWCESPSLQKQKEGERRHVPWQTAVWLHVCPLNFKAPLFLSKDPGFELWGHFFLQLSSGMWAYCFLNGHYFQLIVALAGLQTLVTWSIAHWKWWSFKASRGIILNTHSGSYPSWVPLSTGSPWIQGQGRLRREGDTIFALCCCMILLCFTLWASLNRFSDEEDKHLLNKDVIKQGPAEWAMTFCIVTWANILSTGFKLNKQYQTASSS